MFEIVLLGCGIMVSWAFNPTIPADSPKSITPDPYLKRSGGFELIVVYQTTWGLQAVLSLVGIRKRRLRI
jgi:hypothetical protein